MIATELKRLPVADAEKEIAKFMAVAVDAAHRHATMIKRADTPGLEDSIAVQGTVDRVMGAMAHLSFEDQPADRMRLLCINEGKAPEGSLLQNTLLNAIQELHENGRVPGKGFGVPLANGFGVRPGLEKRLVAEYGGPSTPVPAKSGSKREARPAG